MEKYLEQFKEDFAAWKSEYTDKVEKEVKNFLKENPNYEGDGIDVALGRVMLSEIFLLKKRIEILEGLSHKHEETFN